jgi:hypothetical protein
MLHVLGKIAAASAPLDENATGAHYQQAMALARERDMPLSSPIVTWGLGKLYRSTGKRKLAHEHLTTATPRKLLPTRAKETRMR